MVILTWILGVLGTLGVAGTVAAFIFFPTIAVPVLEKLTQVLLGCKACLIVAAFVAAVLASFWYGRHGQYERGYDAALSAIATEDAAAITRATEKRMVWQECRQRDGNWDQSTGECK